MSHWRQEALLEAYRQLASGLSGLLRAYRQLWPRLDRDPASRDMVAGALAQLEALGVKAVYLQEEEPPGDWLADCPLELFSIRWTEQSPGACSLCRQVRVGCGPVGWLQGAGPVCDGCLLERARDLGSVLMAVNVMREMGAVDEASEEQPEEAMVGLATYARLYERVSADKWPYRAVGLLEYLRHLEERFDRLFSDQSVVERLRRRGEGDGEIH